MSFWFRYSVLVLLCVITPLGLGFWLDTQSQLERAKGAGEAGAMVADPAIAAQLTLAAHQRVGQALQLAQFVGDEKLLVPVKGALRPEVPARFDALLGASEVPPGGFAWILDETGAVLARRGTARERDPDRITGHPLYVATQLGFALDGSLRLGDALFLVGAAPVSKDGEAQGAVLVARPVDKAMVAELANATRIDLTLVQKDEVLVSTLPTDVAAHLVSSLESNATGPSHGGRLAQPLPAKAGFLPLFVPHDVEGMAYSSLSRPMLGQDDARWVISVENGRALANLAERQQSILGILVAALLLAIVIGLSLSRTFVRPIDQLTDHLSGLQQGRGEREISESQVSRPFRRLAKLINMTVQRIPPGGVYGFDASERRPSTDPPQPQAPDLGAAMLSAAPSAIAEPGPPGVPPSFTGAAPINISALGGGAGARGSSTARPAALPVDPLPPPVAPPAPALAAPARAPSFTPNRSEPAFAADPAADLMGGLGTPDLDQALAAAARSVDSDFDPAAQPASASRKPRSASTIRGAPSTNVSQSMLDMNTSALQALGSARPDSVRGAPLADRGPFAAGAASAEVSSPFLGLLDDAKQPSGGFAIPPATTSTSRMGGSAAFAGGSAASFGFGSAGVPDEEDAHSDDFKSEATVVAAPNDYLLQASARDMTATGFAALANAAPERTLVAEVPKNLLAESKKPSGDLDDPEDIAHFKETYEKFVDMRRQCGEPTGDLVFERFVTKLRKNREQLMSKYACRTVRFQVYEKDGKAALKATPVRA